MILKLSVPKLVVAGFIIIITAMSLYIFEIYRNTSAPAVNTTIESEQKPQTQESARAFVKIGKYATSTQRRRLLEHRYEWAGMGEMYG